MLEAARKRLLLGGVLEREVFLGGRGGGAKAMAWGKSDNEPNLILTKRKKP